MLLCYILYIVLYYVIKLYHIFFLLSNPKDYCRKKNKGLFFKTMLSGTTFTLIFPIK